MARLVNSMIMQIMPYVASGVILWEKNVSIFLILGIKKVLSQYSEGADLSGPTWVLYIANRPPSSSVLYTIIV